jgi:translation initiation factor 5B
MLEGHGTTIDCILVSGTLKIGDNIVVLGFNGPICTKIKALLTPHDMKDIRIKDEYFHND